MGNDEFLLRTGIEEYLISLRPLGASTTAEFDAALTARAAFDLRFCLETGFPEVVAIAREIAAALDGSSRPLFTPEHASRAEVTDLVNLLERELHAGRLLVRQNQVQSLGERP